jgi:hypothetical protein
MLEVSQSVLTAVVERELKGLIASNPFVIRFAMRLGSELHYRLVDWPWEDETEYSRHRPVLALHESLVGGWSLDPEWLANEDGEWFDDDDIALPSAIRRSFTPHEQLAAYGLWLLRVELPAVGPLPTEETNSWGWTREQVLEHQANCRLLSYQALALAQKILLGNELTAEEVAKAARAATARKAADALHSQPGGSRDKRVAIRAIWATGKYSSRDICAEQECAALSMSFATARKALRGTPEPPSRSK